jgi:hypothetical protein
MRIVSITDFLFLSFISVLLLFFALPESRSRKRDLEKTLYRNALQDVRRGLEEYFALYGRYPVNSEPFLSAQLESLEDFTFPLLLKSSSLQYRSNGAVFYITLPLPGGGAFSTQSRTFDILYAAP